MPFLFLTGKSISGVTIVDNSFPLKYQFGSIYTDSFGQTDIGFEYGSVLHLEPLKAKKLFEMIVTGEARRLIETKDPSTITELQAIYLHYQQPFVFIY